MQITSPMTRAQRLAADIETDIDARSLSRGDPLGTLDDWRERTSFARATVSEAIRILVDRGLVEIRPGRGGGIFVARTGPVVRLRHTLLTVHGEAPAVADAIAIREALEPLIVADAARSRSKSDTAALAKLLAALEDAVDDRDSFMRANWALHERIARVTSNRMLAAVYLSMTELIRDSSSLASGDSGPEDVSYSRLRYEVHESIVLAIIAGDLDAAATAVARHQS